jgi:uncharacterized Fe-S center protein
VQSGDITAVKIHFGDKGNVTHVSAPSPSRSCV